MFSFDKKKKEITIELGVILIVGIIFGVGSISSAFSGDINMIDEGQFAGWAYHMLQGSHMYKDLYITYGPLYVYPLYILFKLFEPSLFLVRIFMLVGSIVTLWTVNLYIRKLHIKRIIRYIALTTLIFFPAVTYRQGVGLVSILFFVNALQTGKKSFFFLTGVSTAISFLTSPEIGIFTIATILLLSLYKLGFQDQKKLFLKNLYYTGLASLVVYTLFAVWAHHEGWLQAYIVATFEIFKLFSGVDLPNGQNFPILFSTFPQQINPIELLKFFSKQPMLMHVALIVYAVSFSISSLFLIAENEKKTLIIFATSAFGLFLYSSTIGVTDIDHFLFTIPPLTIIFSYFIDTAVHSLKKSTAKSNRVISALAIILVLLFTLRLSTILRFSINTKLTNATNSSFTSSSIPHLGPINISHKQHQYINLIRNYIQSNTNRDENIFFVSNEPAMYMVSERKSASKYMLPYIPNRLDKRKELLNELKTNKPKIVLYDTMSWPVDTVSNITRLPEIVRYLDENYAKTKILNGRVVVYEYTKTGTR